VFVSPLKLVWVEGLEFYLGNNVSLKKPNNERTYQLLIKYESYEQGWIVLISKENLYYVSNLNQQELVKINC